MNSRLIGRMILARWLDYPPDRYEKQVEAVTRSPIYRQISAQVETVPLPQALLASAGRDGSATDAVAQIVPDNAQFAIAYRHPAWGIEFRVDGRPPTTGDVNPELDWLLRRLRPINTRNRLTHLILLTIAEAQAVFLHSGLWSDLEPLALTALRRRPAAGQAIDRG